MGERARHRRRPVAGVATVALAMLVAGTGPTVADEPEGVRYLDEVFDEIHTTSDIPYGSAVDHTGTEQTLLLDVHEPAGDTATDRAAVVWVHGGFFKRGSKEWYQTEWSQFARAGYVTVSINYRLDPDLPEGAAPAITELRVPEYLAATVDAQHDAQAAVRWVRAHADELGIDPDRIAIAGHSAGAITAQLVGFNDHDPGASGNPGISSAVAAVVASAGGSLPAAMVQIDPGEPPLLVTHGVIDDIVPYPAAVPSCALTVALGNVCEQVLDPDQDHGSFGFDQWRAFLYRRMIDPRGLQLPTSVEIVGLDSLPGTAEELPETLAGLVPTG